jgi:hypothetical protein
MKITVYVLYYLIASCRLHSFELPAPQTRRFLINLSVVITLPTGINTGVVESGSLKIS